MGDKVRGFEKEKYVTGSAWNARVGVRMLQVRLMMQAATHVSGLVDVNASGTGNDGSVDCVGDITRGGGDDGGGR